MQFVEFFVGFDDAPMRNFVILIYFVSFPFIGWEKLQYVAPPACVPLIQYPVLCSANAGSFFHKAFPRLPDVIQNHICGTDRAVCSKVDHMLRCSIIVSR